MAPLILNLNARWKGVVYFTFRPLYLQERPPGPIKSGRGCCLGPTAPTEVLEDENIPSSFRDTKPRSRSPRIMTVMTRCCTKSFNNQKRLSSFFLPFLNEVFPNYLHQTSFLSEFLLNTGSGSRVPSIFLLDVDYCGTTREKTYLHAQGKRSNSL